jgi:hypothetical protein
MVISPSSSSWPPVFCCQEQEDGVTEQEEADINSEEPVKKVDDDYTPENGREQEEAFGSFLQLSLSTTSPTLHT